MHPVNSGFNISEYWFRFNYNLAINNSKHDTDINKICKYDKKI